MRGIATSRRRDGCPNGPVLVASDDRQAAERLVERLQSRSVAVERGPSEAAVAPSPATRLILLDMRAARDTRALVRVLTATTCPVVAVVADATERSVIAPLASGAAGVILIDSDVEVVIDALKAVQARELFIDPAAARVLIQSAMAQVANGTDNPLTATELRILRHFPRGSSTSQIAAEIGSSPNTVKTHIRHILAKLGCRDRAEAARVARDRGLIVGLEPHTTQALG